MVKTECLHKPGRVGMHTPEMKSKSKLEKEKSKSNGKQKD